jgi:hypothetical protein
MTVAMNAGMRPLILAPLFALAVSGCAQWPAESARAESAGMLSPTPWATPSPPPAEQPVAAAPSPAPVSGVEERAQNAPVPPLSSPSPIIRPGECWVQAVIQPKPISKPLEIVVRDAVNDIEITPPALETTRKEVVVREGGVTYRIEPPVYKRVTEKVMVRPEVRRSVVVPAVFEEREVQIEIEAAHTIMERCNASTVHRTAEAPVQMLCARTIPAKTKTVKRKILVQPETTREVVEPAVYKDVTRWVLETPARAIPIDLPPRTAQLKVREITRPEQIEERQVPPEIKRLLATTYEGEPSVVFRRAVCDQALSTTLVRDLQQALKQAGFDPGRTDGKLGRQTFHALLNYQRQNGLAQGALTYESLEHLGITAEPSGSAGP